MRPATDSVQVSYEVGSDAATLYYKGQRMTVSVADIELIGQRLRQATMPCVIYTRKGGLHVCA